MKRLSLFLLGFSALAAQAQTHLVSAIEHWVKKYPEAITYISREYVTPNKKAENAYTLTRYDFSLTKHQAFLLEPFEKAYQKESQRSPLPERSLLVQRSPQTPSATKGDMHSIAYSRKKEPLLVGIMPNLMLVRGASPQRDSHDLLAVVDYGERMGRITGKLYVIERPKELAQGRAGHKKKTGARAIIKTKKGNFDIDLTSEEGKQMMKSINPKDIENITVLKNPKQFEPEQEPLSSPSTRIFIQSPKGDFEFDPKSEEDQQIMKSLAPEEIEHITVFKDSDLLTHQPQNLDEYLDRLDFYQKQLEKSPQQWDELIAHRVAKYGEYLFSKKEQEQLKLLTKKVQKITEQLKRNEWPLNKKELEALENFSTKIVKRSLESDVSKYASAHEDFQLNASVSGFLNIVHDDKEETISFAGHKAVLDVDFHEQEARTQTRWTTNPQDQLARLVFTILAGKQIEASYAAKDYATPQQENLKGVTTRFTQYHGRELFFLTFEEDLHLLPSHGKGSPLIIRAGSYLFFNTASR